NLGRPPSRPLGFGARWVTGPRREPLHCNADALHCNAVTRYTATLDRNGHPRSLWFRCRDTRSANDAVAVSVARPRRVGLKMPPLWLLRVTPIRRRSTFS